MAVSQRAWDVLAEERGRLFQLLEIEKAKFEILDAQVARLWNQLGQLSKQHQDVITTNHLLVAQGIPMIELGPLKPGRPPTHFRGYANEPIPPKGCTTTGSDSTPPQGEVLSHANDL